MRRLKLQSVWVCRKPGQACLPRLPFLAEPQGFLGVKAIQGLLWRRGRGWRLGRLDGLARGWKFWSARPRPAPGAMRCTRTVLWLRLALPLGLALVGPLAVGWASDRVPIYVSSWAVRVSQGYREAESLARKFGFVNLGQVSGTRTVGTLQDPRPRQTWWRAGPLAIKKSQPTPASTSFKF